MVNPVAEIEAQLIGPGGAFEIVEEEVLGERIKVFKGRNRSLREILENSINHGDSEYIVCADRRISYRQHLAQVSAVAHNLHSRYGIGKGDRVAILADNHPEWIVTFWATVSIGAICVGLNGWWSRDEILYGLDDADPQLLVGDRKRLARIQGVDLAYPVVTMEDDFSLLLDDPAEPDSESAKEAALPECVIEEDDPALILYTSGTTGRPKGALLSHRGLITFVSSSIFSGLRMLLLAEQSGKSRSAGGYPSCGMFSAPLFHLSGLFTGAVTSLAVGMKTVWTPGRFDPEKVLGLIEKERVTTWASLGSMASRVLESPHFDQYDVSSVTHLGSGGAPTSRALQQKMTSGFRGTGGSMALGYGLTESTGVGTHNWGALLDAHPNSVGRVFPGIEIRVCAQGEQSLPEGQEGEICIRGSGVMLGYWRNPEATARVIGPGRWLRTGDIGYFNGDFLYINSRARDIILRNAENIYPVEIEHCLEAHPAVKEAAVIGVEHPELGQEVKAIIVAADGAAPDADKLRAFCREHLSAFKVPSQWDIRSEPLPRNAAGKVLKNVLSGEVETRLIEE